MKKILIKNGKLISTQGKRKADILIENDKIKEIAVNITDNSSEHIDAKGKWIFPGFIDAHTHMGVPIKDTTSADDFESGSRAALFGGVTTIIDFTIQGKGESLLSAIGRRKKEADGRSSVDYALHCNVTDLNQDRLDEVPEVVKQGIISFKVFTAYKEAGMQISDRQIMDLLWKVKHAKGTLMFHAENGDLIDFLTEKYIKYRKTTTPYHGLSRPAEAEIEAVSRIVTLNQFAQCPIYFVHLSTAEAVQIAGMAKKNKQPVYLETCPQYLMFDKTIYDQKDGVHYIASPPFRAKKDQEFLWQALNNPVIDVVATDHCPFSREQKNMGQGLFHKTPNGLPGVETLFTLLYNEGVQKKRLSLERLVSLISEEPARLFGLFPRKGILLENSDADLVIFNPREKGIITAEALHSNIDWSPYEGIETEGHIEAVMSRGNWLLTEGKINADNLGQGKFVEALP